MILDRTKLISVRIDDDTVDEIQKFVLDNRYWSRNAVINCILTSVFKNAKRKDILELVRWWKHSSVKLEISVKVSGE